ncbi:MAG: hypothetical protein HY538_00295 [Deltaproteobacteria bacterium]|nr:hypothetical protein [Deltaproteobacteria bacterium]
MKKKFFKKEIYFLLILLLGFCWAQAELQYVHSDHLGSASAATDASGAVIQIETYTPFGEIVTPHLLSSPQRGEERGEGATPHLYTGQELDHEAELYYYGARYYDPVLARFESVDAVLGEEAYGYARNRPLHFVDPDGFSPEDPEKELFFLNARTNQTLQRLGRTRWRLQDLSEEIGRDRGKLEETDGRIARITRRLARLGTTPKEVERGRLAVAQRSKLGERRVKALAELAHLEGQFDVALKDEARMLEELEKLDLQRAGFQRLYPRLKLGIGVGIALFLPEVFSKVAEASEIPELEVASLFVNPQQFVERGEEASKVVVRAIEGDEDAYSQVMSFIEGALSRFSSEKPADSDEMGFWDREANLPNNSDDPCFWGCP